MKRFITTIFFALASQIAIADVTFLVPHSTTSYFTPCFPLYSTASSGAGTLTGMSGTDGDFVISIQSDNEATETEFQTTADIETIATIGTYAAPTADTDIRFGECATSGTYQLQFRNTFLSTSGTKLLTVKLTDAVDTMADQIVYINLDVSTQTSFVDAIWDEPCAGHTTTDTPGDNACDEFDALETTVGDAATDTTAILVDTGTTLPATLGTPAGADMSADIAAVKAETALIVADTNELQTDDIPGTLGTPAGADISADIAAVKAETALIVADTGTDGVVLANDSITAAKIAADAIGASEIAADAIGSSEIADNAIGATEIATDAIGALEIAADAIGSSELASTAAAEVWDVQCEDQNGGYSCRETMSMLLSEALGTCVYTSGTRTWVCSDPSGTETRFTIVYGIDLDGDRDTSTPAPFTP